MSKAGDFAFTATAATAFFTPLLLPPLRVAIHLWTVLIVAWQGAEVPAVVAAFFLPVLAELTLGAMYWDTTGVLHPYCVVLLSYVSLWGASWFSVVLLVKIDPLPVNP
jgi:hypothetical protein